MNKKLSLVARLAASSVLLGLLAWKTDWQRVGETFSHMNIKLWLLAALLYLGAQLVSSLRWQILARRLGFQQPLGQFINFYFIGMFFNLVLPTSVGGDVVRAWYLDGGSKRRSTAFLAVFQDRLNGLLVLLTIACIAVAVCPLDLPRWVSWGVWGSTALGLAGLASLPLLARYHLLGRENTELVQGLVRSPATVLGLRPLALSVVVQVANVILVLVIGTAIDAPVPGAFYWILVPVVSLATMLPVSVNGMGVREWTTLLLLKPLGVDNGTSASLVFLWFIATSVVSLSGALFYLFGRFPRFEVQSDDGSIGGDSDQGRTGQSEAAA